ncbi:MAG TPA: sulfatase-like hydrolase/transferase [Candidatus Sulfotelmatobacter sp.]|nr:sulfatase-like hydrolase/transferase [Candidatus Sulfotelmatobacter sp.]
MIFGQRFLLVLLLLAAAYPASLLASNSAKPPNVILITLDTTRADRMGFLGSHVGLTPNLDGVAHDSLIFSGAYAHVPLTTPSHATILTGTYPQFNHLGDLGNALPKDTPYVPALLHLRGYATAAFVGSQVLDPDSAAAPGFDRGFDTYDAGFHSRAEGEDRYSSEERRAGTVVDHALLWLKQQQHRPFFLWVHLYDPHDPYDPPEPFKSKYASAPYDGEIAYMDACLGKFFGALKSAGLYNSSAIAIVADHGEAFGEHGEQSHGFFLYDETLHVPLLLKMPGNRRGNAPVSRRVGLVDVAPTLLQVAGFQAPPAMQGVSLLAEEKSQAQSGDLPIYSETNYPQRAFGWSWLRSWRAGKYLYVDAPRRELYDEASDPKALHNLADVSPAVADTLQTQLDEFRRKTSAADSGGSANLTPQQAEKLQALGYLMSSGSYSQDEGKRGPDPKDKIETANRLHRALVAMENQQYAEAVPQLQQVAKEEPQLALANLELGRAFNGLQQYGQALPWLQKAVQLEPQSGRAHYELGVALGETGDWAGSAAQLEQAVAQAPGSDDLHYYLARAYDNIGRAADAEKNFRRALQINPAHYRANLFLGRLLGMQNNPSAALPFLQKAVALEPASPDAHKFLANIYLELGDAQKASAEQAEAQRLQTDHP